MVTNLFRACRNRFVGGGQGNPVDVTLCKDPVFVKNGSKCHKRSFDVRFDGFLLTFSWFNVSLILALF